MSHLVDDVPAPGIDGSDSINLITEEFDPNGGLLQICWPHFHDITPNPKMSPFKSDVVTLKEKVHQFCQKFITPQFLALANAEHHILVILRISQTVNTTYAGHHDHIIARD